VTEPPNDSAGWYLKGRFGADHLERRRIQSFPFVIGRSSSCNLQLTTSGVSGRHAEIVLVDDRIQLRDLNSTNGTFMNGKRLAVESEPVKDGDVLHFASEEVRLQWVEGEESSPQTEQLAVITDELPFDWTARSVRLDRILDGNLEAWFQPIVKWDSTLIAWEALGRGRIGDEIVSPAEMFQTARENGRELELCRALRRQALETAKRLPEPRLLFLNCAADDLADWSLLLDELRTATTHGLSIVVEIYEGAVTNTESMSKFHEDLAAIGCGLAFDDFGAGQSRLRELTELRPQYLKFDASLIRGIDQAPTIRKDMVKFFVGFVNEYGVSSLAEGVEREEEAAFCEQAGISLAQGYYFAYPAPLPDVSEG